MQQIQNFSKIGILLYAVVDSEQNKKTPSFSLASHAPKKWAIALGVTPWGPKYAQEPWKGSDLPQASEMGHSS